MACSIGEVAPSRKGRSMDPNEKRVHEFLIGRGYSSIIYEPDGNIPPDFSIDSRIAVEVRALDQSFASGGTKRGLRVDGIPLRQKVQNLVTSLGQSNPSKSWLVHLWFRRPVEPWKDLEPRIREELRNFMEGETQEAASLRFWEQPQARPSPIAVPTRKLLCLGELDGSECYSLADSRNREKFGNLHRGKNPQGRMPQV